MTPERKDELRGMLRDLLGTAEAEEEREPEEPDPTQGNRSPQEGTHSTPPRGRHTDTRDFINQLFNR